MSKNFLLFIFVFFHIKNQIIFASSQEQNNVQERSDQIALQIYDCMLPHIQTSIIKLTTHDTALSENRFSEMLKNLLRSGDDPEQTAASFFHYEYSRSIAEELSKQLRLAVFQEMGLNFKDAFYVYTSLRDLFDAEQKPLYYRTSKEDLFKYHIHRFLSYYTLNVFLKNELFKIQTFLENIFKKPSYIDNIHTDL